MTIDTAFRQVFGEPLKEYGFVKIKGRQPIYARCINNEIVHVITFRKSYLGKEFCMICGVATVYRAVLRFPENRKELETDLDWFDMMYQFKEIRDASIWYSDQTIVSAMKYALSLTKKVIIPALDDVPDIKGCTEYYLKMQRFFSSLSLRGLYENKEFAVKYPKDRENEAMLWLLLDDREYFCELCGQWHDMRLRQIESVKKSGLWDSSDSDEDKAAAERTYTRSIEYYDQVFSDKEWLSAAHAELARRRAHNLQTLKEYGLITEE